MVQYLHFMILKVPLNIARIQKTIVCVSPNHEAQFSWLTTNIDPENLWLDSGPDSGVAKALAS